MRPNRRWSTELSILLKPSVFFSEDSIHHDATESTEVILNCSLCGLSMLASKATLENLEYGRDIVVLAVENFRGRVSG